MATKSEMTHAVTVAAVPANLLTMAVDAARQAFGIFNPHRKELNRVGINLNGAHFLLGKACLKEAGGDFSKASAFWAGATSHAEDTIRNECKATEGLDKKPSIAQALPSWSPSKSPITSALDKKINLCDAETFKSWNDVKNALREQGRAARTTTGATQRSDKGPVDLKVTDKLRAVLESLMSAIAGVSDPVAQDAIADTLMPVVAVIGTIGKPDAKTVAKETAKRGGRRV